MKKVIKEEQTQLNQFDLKKLTLKGMSVLLALTMTATISGCSKKAEAPTQSVVTSQVEQKYTSNETGDNPYMNSERTVSRDHTIVNPFENFSVDSNIEDISDEQLAQDRQELADNNAKEGFENFEVMYVANDPDIAPYAPTAQILVDDIILELVHPEEVVENGQTVYKAPAGYVLQGDICYRLISTTGVAPTGYVLGTDGRTLYEVDTEIQYVVPEEINHFLVGSKEVEVIHSRKETIGNLNYDMLPMEYERVNDFGYIITDAEPIQTLSR